MAQVLGPSRNSHAEIVEHVCSAITTQPLALDPFPHLVVDDFLPPEIFGRIVAGLPAASTFDDAASMGWKSVSQYSNHGTSLVRNIQGSQDLWRELDQALCHDDVQAALQGAFTETVEEARGRLQLRRELRLDCTGAGARLAPHTDSPILFMKSLIYLSARASHPSLDTVLYVPRDPTTRIQSLGPAGDYTGDTYRHEEAADHLERARVSFRPNRLLTFPRTAVSLHGLEPQHPETTPRYLLSLHYKHRR